MWTVLLEVIEIECKKEGNDAATWIGIVGMNGNCTDCVWVEKHE